MRSRAFLQRFDATDEVSAIGKVDVVDSRIGTSLGDAIVLALKGSRSVNYQGNTKSMESRFEARSHRVQHHVTESCTGVRL